MTPPTIDQVVEALCVRIRRIQRLLRLKKPPASSHPPPASHSICFLLELPVDLLVLIMERLGLCDKFILSHTCRALRSIIGQDWRAALGQLECHERLAFVTELAYTSPNLWICAGCDGVHHIDPSDTPSNPSLPCEDAWSVFGYGIKAHHVRQNHVQLALKFCRLPCIENTHREYLKAIMAPYRKESLFPGGAEANYPDAVKMVYQAQPRIIRRRFVLREEWKVSCPPSARDKTPASIRHALLDCFNNSESSLNVCIHLHIIKGLTESRGLKVDFDDEQLEDQLERALTSEARRQIHFSCSKCPTDCEIQVSDCRTWPLTIRAWKNFGRGESPRDPVWMARIYHFSQNDKDFVRLLYGTHVPGSIRNTWLST